MSNADAKETLVEAWGSCFREVKSETKDEKCFADY